MCRRAGRVFLTTGSALRQLPRLNLCASARRPRFLAMGSLLYGPPQLNSFNSGKRIAPAVAAESLCVGAPAMFLTMGNPIYGPLRLNFFNNGKRIEPAAAAESLCVGASAAFF